MNMPIFSVIWRGLFLLSLFLLGGCLQLGVQPEPATTEPASKPNPVTSKLTSEIAGVKQEIKKASGIQNRALSGVEHRLSLLEKEVNELRGSLEVAQHENKQLGSRLTSIETMAMTRNQPTMNNLTEPNLPKASLPSAESPVVAAEVPEAAIPFPVKEQNAPKGTAKETYESAYQKLLARQFPASLQEFTLFLTQFPHNPLADNAQYWIGELHYVQKQYPEALQAFNNVLVSWPASTKVPACLLKIGFSFYELGDMENARLSLTRLVNDYPASTAVSLANQRLQKINERVGE
jgi:tol-pal system protein YbgF